MWQFIWRLYSPIDEFWRYLFHVAKIHGITLTDVGEIVTIAGAFLALISAVVLYMTNNRIKASELLISLEKEYKEHIKVFFEIESSYIYDLKYKPYLTKIMEGDGHLNQDEIEFGIKLELAIRYLYLCSKIGKLVLQLNFSLDSVSSGTIVIESGHSLVSATPYRPDPCGFNC